MCPGCKPPACRLHPLCPGGAYQGAHGALRAHVRQLVVAARDVGAQQHVRGLRAGGALQRPLRVPPSQCAQLASPSSCGWLSRLLAAPRTRDEPLSRPGPYGRLRCGRESLPRSPISRAPTPRHYEEALYVFEQHEEMRNGSMWRPRFTPVSFSLLLTACAEVGPERVQRMQALPRVLTHMNRHGVLPRAETCERRRSGLEGGLLVAAQLGTPGLWVAPRSRERETAWAAMSPCGAVVPPSGVGARQRLRFRSVDTQAAGGVRRDPPAARRAAGAAARHTGRARARPTRAAAGAVTRGRRTAIVALRHLLSVAGCPRLHLKIKSHRVV
jgi:hypothetical protein